MELDLKSGYEAKKHISILFVMTALAACSAGSSSNSPSDNSGNTSGTGASSMPVPSQKIIDSEDLTPGLKGVDTNNNGIRDDIDRLIARKYSGTPAIKKAAEQSARELQHFMEATTRQQALTAADEDGRAWACVVKRLPLSHSPSTDVAITMDKEIESLTANTKERFTKYWDSNKLIAGGYFSRPLEPVCD